MSCFYCLISCWYFQETLSLCPLLSCCLCCNFLPLLILLSASHHEQFSLISLLTTTFSPCFASALHYLTLSTHFTFHHALIITPQQSSVSINFAHLSPDFSQSSTSVYSIPPTYHLKALLSLLNIAAIFTLSILMPYSALSSKLFWFLPLPLSLYFFASFHFKMFLSFLFGWFSSLLYLGHLC